MKIYLSTWLTDRSLGDSLTKKRTRNRLLSFYFLLEQKISSSLLVEYVQRGRCDPRQSKILYYYYHPESDSIWSSNHPVDKEPNPDGCVEPISKERAIKLQKELGIDIIPYHNK